MAPVCASGAAFVETRITGSISPLGIREAGSVYAQRVEPGTDEPVGLCGVVTQVEQGRGFRARLPL